MHAGYFSFKVIVRLLFIENERRVCGTTGGFSGALRRTHEVSKHKRQQMGTAAPSPPTQLFALICALGCLRAVIAH